MGFFRKLKVGKLFLGEGSSLSSPRMTRITATGTEINRACDGITATASELNALDGITATVGELNKVDDSVIGAYNAPGAGFSAATGEAHNVSVLRAGDVITTRILVDVTGLTSPSTTSLVIGSATAVTCHIGQITTAVNGVIWGGKFECLETPATGELDIDLTYSTRSTATEGAAIGTLLCNTGELNKAGVARLSADPPANSYLYLATGGGSGGTSAAYTAGQFLIELWGSPS